MPQDKSKTAFTSPERHPNLALAVDQANASIENHCQSLILYQLLKHAPQALATLASRLTYSETKLKQDLKHLQKLGLLSIEIGNTDSPMYTLSDTGWRLAKDISYQLNSANDSTPFRLSREESNLIKALLNKL